MDSNRAAAQAAVHVEENEDDLRVCILFCFFNIHNWLKITKKNRMITIAGCVIMRAKWFAVTLVLEFFIKNV
jgi:hypothetical protein